MLRQLLLVVFVLLAGAGVAIYLLSEYGGEVVVLRTLNNAGETQETHLWLVEDSGFAWLRAGQPGNRWYQNLRERPEVELVRGEAILSYRAVPVETPEARERIQQRIAEKYGVAETVISWLHDESTLVPIRLEPRPE